jgi:hypothetical protein
VGNDVLIGYLHGHTVTASFHSSEINLIGWDLSHNKRLHAWARIQSGGMGLPESRNKVCKALLEGTAEWLFMVDTDMGFDPQTLDQLLSVADKDERPIVGGLCFSQREVAMDEMGGFRCLPTPTIFDWLEHDDGTHHYTSRLHYPANSLIRCGATGAAMLLIHRSVIERIKEAHGETWFNRIVGEDGELMGEDISFFVRTAALSIPLHIHTGIRTTHYKHFWLAESDFFQSFVAPAATETCDVIVPVLHRPQNVKSFMESLRASTGLAKAWFICEEDDQEEIDEVLRYGGEVITSPECHTFAEKVNLAYAMTNAPWLLLVGDDVRFRPGWLDHALDVHRRYGGHVIGTNDLANPRVMRGEHATHPLIKRSYIDELGASWDGPGVVCHEGYRHNFVDDEIVAVAQQRHTFQAALASQVEHMHPIFGKGADDAVYRRGQKSFEVDGKLFAHRRMLHPAT